MTLNPIIQKFNLMMTILVFIWLLYTIGSQNTLKEICKHHDSKVYFYIPHDFKTVKNINPYNNKYHCLKEIEIPTCYMGQKEILFQKKCTINEEIGGTYGYLNK